MFFGSSCWLADWQEVAFRTTLALSAKLIAFRKDAHIVINKINVQQNSPDSHPTTSSMEGT